MNKVRVTSSAYHCNFCNQSVAQLTELNIKIKRCSDCSIVYCSNCNAQALQHKRNQLDIELDKELGIDVLLHPEKKS